VSGSIKGMAGESHRGSVYPVKDMMANAPGFRSLYRDREIHFEEIYIDIIDKAFLPIKKGPIDGSRKQLLETLQKEMDGKVVIKSEEFFLRINRVSWSLRFLQKDFASWDSCGLLIQNGRCLMVQALFWDEPETNSEPAN